MTEYIFTDHQETKEIHRLRLIERAFDESTCQLLAGTGISEGWHCLEVGAGAGSILRWLGERVGPTGLTVAVDKKATCLSDFVGPPYRVVEADIRDYHAEIRFDLIHARYVLIHNHDAQSLIARFKTMLKPGGYMVLEEPDFEAAEWLDYRYAVHGNKVNQAIRALFATQGLDPGYGKRLPMQATNLGFAVMRADTTVHLAPGCSPVASVMAESAFALKDKYLSTGKATEEDIEFYTRGAGDPASWAAYYATVSIVARAPIESDHTFLAV